MGKDKPKHSDRRRTRSTAGMTESPYRNTARELLNEDLRVKKTKLSGQQFRPEASLPPDGNLKRDDMEGGYFDMMAEGGDGKGGSNKEKHEDGMEAMENQQSQTVDDRAVEDDDLSFPVPSKEETDDSVLLAPVTQDTDIQSSLGGLDPAEVQSDEKVGTVVSTFSRPSSKRVRKAQFHALIQDGLFPHVKFMPPKSEIQSPLSFNDKTPSICWCLLKHAGMVDHPDREAWWEEQQKGVRKGLTDHRNNVMGNAGRHFKSMFGKVARSGYTDVWSGLVLCDIGKVAWARRSAEIQTAYVWLVCLFIKSIRGGDVWKSLRTRILLDDESRFCLEEYFTVSDEAFMLAVLEFKGGSWFQSAINKVNLARTQMANSHTIAKELIGKIGYRAFVSDMWHETLKEGSELCEAVSKCAAYNLMPGGGVSMEKPDKDNKFMYIHSNKVVQRGEGNKTSEGDGAVKRVQANGWTDDGILRHNTLFLTIVENRKAHGERFNAALRTELRYFFARKEREHLAQKALGSKPPVVPLNGLEFLL